MNLIQARSKIDAYKNLKLAPGGFLSSILKNDLVGAVLKADSDSKNIISDITTYCWNNLPDNIWGSSEKVEKHLYSLAPTPPENIDIQ